MSSPNRVIQLSLEAEADFADILQYTEETWDAEQADRYALKLDKALNLLRSNPYIGKRKDEYFPGCRVYPVGRHLILYQFSATVLFVVRILHDRTDINRQFN